jgi:hypothetical protein
MIGRIGMAHYGVETRLNPDDTIEAARAFFGYGLGLRLTAASPRCVAFEGGGG